MNRTAWSLFRDLKEMHGEGFMQWLYNESIRETRKLGFHSGGVFWILKKSEDEAIRIMDRFIEESK